MLKREQADLELRQLRPEGWEDRLADLVAGLPAGPRDAGLDLLGRDAQGTAIEDFQRAHAIKQAAGPKIDRLSQGERLHLFESLFPKLGNYVEAAWQLLTRLPYQMGWHRKAFRAPNDPTVSLPRRQQWLDQLVQALGGFGQDLAWCAAWAPHLRSGFAPDEIGLLLAAGLDGGGPEAEEVFSILCDSARGQHLIGGMGRHVSRALLSAARPDGWEFIEKLLLAAQRQEGILRQAILESVDEAHPEAFRRMLHLIRDHNLTRFSATVRAADVWFAFGWDSVSTRVVNEAVDTAITYLDDPKSRDTALRKGEGDDLYLALWSLAFADAPAAVKPAAELLEDGSRERRFIAARLLGQLQLPEARQELLFWLDDDDLRIALCALQTLCNRTSTPDDEELCTGEISELFERVEQLAERLPKTRRTLKPIVWPWCVYVLDRREVVSSLPNYLGDRPATRLLKYLPEMDPRGRCGALAVMATRKKWDAATREAVLALVGDRSSDVRQRALDALRECRITDAEAAELEGLLTRSAGDLRRGVLGLLLGQKDEAALASAQRLLASTVGLQRQAGLELLRELSAANRERQECQARAECFQRERPRLNSEEEKLLAAIREAAVDRPTLDNALGLMNPTERTRPAAPRRLDVAFITPAAVALVRILSDLVHEHREDKIVIKERPSPKNDEADDEDELPGDQELRATAPHETEILLGETEWQFPSPEGGPREEDLAYLPLRAVWEQWWQERPANLRDRDGFEVLRALAWLNLDMDNWKPWQRRSPDCRRALERLGGGQPRVEVPHERVVANLLDWFLLFDPRQGAPDFVLDCLETAYALVPREELARVRDEDSNLNTWRDYDSPFLDWEKIVSLHQQFCAEDWTGAHCIRHWQLLRWKDEPGTAVPRVRPGLVVLLPAYEAGGATDADLFDELLGHRVAERWSGYDFRSLEVLTARKPPHSLRDIPRLVEVVERCRQRILEVELARGDTDTAASRPALALNSLWGSDILTRVLQALGKEPFHRGYTFGNNLGKRCVLSHLVEICHPAADDTPEVFAAHMQQADIGEDRLLDLGFKAPQWASHVEHALGWPGLTEGVWWFLAHTSGSRTEDLRKWKALVAERTALSLADLREGAVDVAWFHRAYQTVGAERWQRLAAAAKFGCDGRGYRRAQFLAGVLLGKEKRTALVSAIRTKHSREAVRALGLLPLAAKSGRDVDLAARYKALQEFRRYARNLGPMSREGALHTAEVGLANLARTAGYPDPLRFQWAMEAAAVADLAEGPISAATGKVQVTLALDENGQPELTITRDGKAAKAVPKEAKKNKKVAELLERQAELKRSASRTRQSLEEAMCRGDTFRGAELQQLFAHPVLAPSLQRLVFVGEGIMGYPERGGKVLRDHTGKREPVKKDEVLRLADPLDLLADKNWHLWQQDAFRREVKQPFKQVFRELYVLTETEKADSLRSPRYAGHQVNPRQAAALWASRGWLVSPEEGVRKTFHDAGLTVWVGFQGGWFTPAEVEGLTLETVQFARRGTWKPLPLAEVPPRIFSEVMRDLDLVVSVAHRGGVDPEASASTVEMRTHLLRETCALLKLTNVRLDPPRALIDGFFGHYTLHLGSGGVHRMPGGCICILPVHAQHRGRLFLPFADDDPKTAEVLSKAILLARDQEIQDPIILQQLRA